jgi:Tfp pilus assembly protein PilV
MSRSRAVLDRLRAEEGFGMIEALSAAMVLLVGIVSTFLVLDGSRKLTTVSERKEVAVHRAQSELERIRAIPFAQLELDTAPSAPVAGDTLDPRLQVSGSDYDWDAASPSNALEPLVIRSAANPDAIAPRQAWTDGRVSGTLDTFVTTSAAGLKRVTVAVRLDGTEPPRAPILLATLITQHGSTP